MDYFQNKCYILHKFMKKHYFWGSGSIFRSVFKRGFYNVCGKNAATAGCWRESQRMRANA